jgi:hypothetical protein
MKRIKETSNEHHWPRSKAASVDCRKRDLVIRISDWLCDKDEPGYDVECYISGIYDWNESKSLTLHSGLTRQQAKTKAIEFAQRQIAKLL